MQIACNYYSHCNTVIFLDKPKYGKNRLRNHFSSDKKKKRPTFFRQRLSSQKFLSPES